MPAMDHSGPGGGRGFGFDPADEAQQASGVKWDTVIGPTSEMELTDLSDLCYAPLTRTEQQVTDHNRNRTVKQSACRTGTVYVCYLLHSKGPDHVF